ncbi:MAG: hypothetical protein KDC47_06150 [Flavobacteriaceae bacterium]|nr:hypothetical protein [Flavobacteriaceae bacterium]
MNLTDEHIERLYQFTRQHYVEWYDLQTELVDHLANDIEAFCLENPTLTFEAALHTSFKKFGIFGFSELVQKRSNALHKKYWKMIFQFLKEFFKLPKILLTLFLIALYYTIFFSIESKNIVIAISLGLLTVIPIYFGARMFLKNKKEEKRTGKKWLFKHVTATFGSFLFFPQIIIQSYQFIDDINWTWFSEVIFSCFVIIFGILFYIAIKIIPHKIEEILQREYPQYNLIKKA